MAEATQNPKIKLISEKNFAGMLNGKEVQLYTLKNTHGLFSQITNYGARVVSLWVPDLEGDFEDIVLGYDSFKGYQNSTEPYFGALIGRYGNRIGKGRFLIDGKAYELVTNNGENHLHGGLNGFHNVVWDAIQLDEQTLEFCYVSEDMEEGFPGKLHVNVRYQLTDNNELKIEYRATTDAPTVVNLTHHSFFNLHGEGKRSINDHILFIDAGYYTPVDAGLIPTGEILPVANTPLDFTQPTEIGARVNEDFEQLHFGMGYDHNWVLNPSEQELRLAARVDEPVSGRSLEVFTNEPGLQFYGGNFLNGMDRGKNGLCYGQRSAFCLETQHFPDSPNHPEFPTTRLNPEMEYDSICVYRFLVMK